MDKQLTIERDELPDEFDSLTTAEAFWDTHSTADYEDVMTEVDFAVNLTGKPTRYFAVAKDLAAALHKVAQQQGISTQTLINLWLQEKLLHMAN